MTELLALRMIRTTLMGLSDQSRHRMATLVPCDPNTGWLLCLRRSRSGVEGDETHVSSGSNPDFLLGGRSSASAECRHWSGRQSVGQAAQLCLAPERNIARLASAVLIGHSKAPTPPSGIYRWAARHFR